LDIEDNPYQDLLMSLDGACAWIDPVLEPAGEPKCGVLVHCVQGISRSGAVIIAYMMRKRKMSYETALDLARQYRAVIVPNSGFADQLRLWQHMSYTIYENASQNDGTLKPKQQYEDWRANRGILISRAQEVKQREIQDKMMNIAVSLGDKIWKMRRYVDELSNAV
jgi:dual specificity phosphatase 12